MVVGPVVRVSGPVIRVVGTSSNPARTVQLPLTSGSVELSARTLTTVGVHGEAVSVLPELAVPLSIAWKGQNLWRIELQQNGPRTFLWNSAGERSELPTVAGHGEAWVVSASMLIGEDGYESGVGTYRFAQHQQTFTVEFPHVTEALAAQWKSEQHAARDAAARERYAHLLYDAGDLQASMAAHFENYRTRAAATMPMVNPGRMFGLFPRASRPVDPASLTHEQIQQAFKGQLEPFGSEVARFASDAIFLDAWRRLDQGFDAMAYRADDGGGHTIEAPFDPRTGRILAPFKFAPALSETAVIRAFPLLIIHRKVSLSSADGTCLARSCYSFNLRDQRGEVAQLRDSIQSQAEERLRALQYSLRTFPYSLEGSTHEIETSFRRS